MRRLTLSLIYPCLALLSAVYAWYKFNNNADLQWAFVTFAVLRFCLFLLMEWAWPCRREWGMSWASFKRDLKFMLAGAALNQAVRLGTGLLSIGMATASTSHIAAWPLIWQVLAAVLLYEFAQYWLHRASHTAPGAFGRFLWRVHAVHHMPKRIYFMMHPVMHPLNMLYTMALGLIPTWVLGVSPEAAFVFHMVLGLQGLFSHLNVDIRAGWLNYLLIGTELHRYHHSAKLDEAGNFGVLTPFWDLVFGSFVYRPGQLPDQLGLVDPTNYPSSQDFLACMRLPFHGVCTQPHDPEP